jgi:hypothetical protein
MNKLEKVLKKIKKPADIQNYLNSIAFNFEKDGETCMSPKNVAKEAKAHCLEGAIFAAAALRNIGLPPLLFDLKSTAKDFDHVVAIFKSGDKWGAISKTNHAVLRYREPIYPTLYSLALSYFHEYFLDNGTKTLRSFSSRPYRLPTKDLSWINSDQDLWEIGAALDEAPHKELLSKANIKNLRKADKIEIAAGKLVENKK